jgi:hypothetical protein
MLWEIALTTSGAISGVSEPGLIVYKGVPFAAPDDARYKALMLK